MPKVKTNSGAKKRFKFTGTGKTKKQKRNLTHQTVVDSSDIKQVKDLLRLR